MADWTIVGGGIAGLLAGRLLQLQGQQVTLIERATECGGLLRSWQAPDGLSFDYGTHIPALTGDADIDAILFPVKDGIEWRQLDVLKVGNYFGGVLNQDSQFIDLNALDPDHYQRGLTELLHLPDPLNSPANLEDALQRHYGHFLTGHVFEPLLRRFYKMPLADLAPNAHSLLGYGRVIALDSMASRRLKKIAFFDERLAFNHYSEGASSTLHRYPVRGGAGRWIENIVSALRRDGAHFILDAAITTINRDGERIDSLGLADGRVIDADHLVWTLPPAMLLRLLQIPVSKPPNFVPTLLHHFVADMPVRSDLHYVYCNDPDMDSFRITLYDNLQSHSAGGSRMTVEACNWGGETAEAHGEKILGELRTMGLLEPTAAILALYSEPIAQGFPVPGLALQAQAAAYMDACATVPNLVLAGRSTGMFFMRDVLFETKRNVLEAVAASEKIQHAD